MWTLFFQCALQGERMVESQHGSLDFQHTSGPLVGNLIPASNVETNSQLSTDHGCLKTKIYPNYVAHEHRSRSPNWCDSCGCLKCNNFTTSLCSVVPELHVEANRTPTLIPTLSRNPTLNLPLSPASVRPNLHPSPKQMLCLPWWRQHLLRSQITTVCGT